MYRVASSDNPYRTLNFNDQGLMRNRCSRFSTSFRVMNLAAVADFGGTHDRYCIWKGCLNVSLHTVYGHIKTLVKASFSPLSSSHSSTAFMSPLFCR